MPPLAQPLPLLLATGGLIGATFPLGKLAGEAGVPPLVWSFFIAAGSALVLVAALAARREAVALDKRHLRYDLMAGLISLAIPNALVFSVIPRLGAGFTSILFTLSPILTLAFSALLRLRRTTPLGLAGIGVGFAGALVIVMSKGQIDRPAEPAWLLLALLVPVSLAAGNVYRTLDWPPGASGLRLAAGMNVAAAMVLALASILLLGSFPVETIATTPSSRSRRSPRAQRCSPSSSGCRRSGGRSTFRRSATSPRPWVSRRGRCFWAKAMAR